MQNVQRIVLVDFGAQYTQLIARRVREAKVFCEVVSYLTPLSEILEKKPVGIILSGGPASVLDADAPHIDPAIYEQGIPVLGICYGMQLTASPSAAPSSAPPSANTAASRWISTSTARCLPA